MLRWLVRILAVLGVIVITFLTSRYFAAADVNPVIPTPDPIETANKVAECSKCHEMTPEVLTWQVSAHSKFDCTFCHTNKKEVQYSTASNGEHPIKIVDQIPNSVCLKCHTANRVISPSGDLQIPHQKHLKAGVTCVTCHYGVAHAKIAERPDLSGIVERTDYDAWNLNIAAKLATKTYIQPSMWTCIDCHKKGNVTRQCSACHTTIPTLPSHDLPNWNVEHGKYARSNLGECINCHATPGIPALLATSTGDKATDFARAQQFCTKCHLRKPMSHQSDMAPLHPEVVSNRGVKNCFTCHDAKQPQPGEQVPQLYCNQCHWFNN